MEQIMQAAETRVKRSIEILKRKGVPYIDWLPPYISLGLRSKEEICNRAICLMIVAVRAEGLELDLTGEIIKQYEIEANLTPEEIEFLSKDDCSFEDRAKFIWRYESYLILLWVLGYIEKLERPENICEAEWVTSIIHSRSKEQFVKEADLRSLEEVFDQADLTLRYHWAARNEILKGNLPPTNLDNKCFI